MAEAIGGLKGRIGGLNELLGAYTAIVDLVVWPSRQGVKALGGRRQDDVAVQGGRRYLGEG